MPKKINALAKKKSRLWKINIRKSKEGLKTDTNVKKNRISTKEEDNDKNHENKAKSNLEEEDPEEEDESEEEESEENEPEQKEAGLKEEKLMFAVGNNLKTDILNNTKKAEVDIIVFNRVPKVGSQSLMALMVRLGKINGYVHARDPAKAIETVLMKTDKQKDLIRDLLTRPKPHAYSQHIAHINFTRFHMPKPIYINLVRHPIERVISWYYYFRAEWYHKDMKDKLGDKAPKMPSKEFLNLDFDTCVEKKDIHCVFEQGQVKNPAGDHRRQTLFFCGHNRNLCMPFNSRAAMQRAKRTVEEDYAVVGTWEDTNITLTVLEHYIPRFFRYAKVAYYLGEDDLSKINKNPDKKPVSNVSRQIIAKNLTHEIEFYEFCKQRLYLQYAAISKKNMVDEDDYLMLPEFVFEEVENKE